MKTGKTLQELVNEIERRDRGIADHIANTGALHIRQEVVDDPDTRNPATPQAEIVPRYLLDVPGIDTYGINDLAHRQLGTWAGIPARYYERMRLDAPNLFLRNVRHWMHTEPAPRMLRTLDGKVRAVLSSSFLRINNQDMAETMLGMVAKQKSDVVSCDVTDSRLYIKGTFPHVERHLVPTRSQKDKGQVGDVLRFGWQMRNSEVGLGSAVLSIFAEVLACTNGMTFPKEFAGVSRRHVGKRVQLTGHAMRLSSARTQRKEIEYVQSAMRDTFEHVANPANADEIVARLNKTTEREITGDVHGAVQTLRREVTLSENEGSSVLAHLAAGGDLSQWGLINAVTRTAEDLDNYDRASELESIGGKMMDMSNATWRRISEAQPVRA